MKKKVPSVEQMTQTECGLCCCLSILHYYNNREKIIDLRSDIEKGRDGYSLHDLKKLLINRGFVAETYGVKQVGQISKLPTPFIAFWDDEHFVVVYQFKKDRVYIMNPASGYEDYSTDEFSQHFSNAVLLTRPAENYKPIKSKYPSPWIEVKNSIFSNKKGIIIALFFSLISYLITLLVPQITSKIINVSINELSVRPIKSMAVLLLGLSLLYLFSVICRSFGMLISNLAFSNNIETKTFKHLLQLPYKFFEIRSKGDVLYRVSSLSGFRELFTNQIVNGFIDLGTIICILWFMFSKSILLTFITLFLSFIIIIFLLLSRKPMSDTVNKELIEQSRLYGIENEALNTISSIKISGLEDSIFDSWNDHLKNLLNKYKKRSIVYSMYNTVTSTFQIFAPLLILVVGILKIPSNVMSLGDIIAFQSLAAILFGSEMALFNAYTQYILAEGYLKRVSDIWYETEEIVDENLPIIKFDGSILVKNLSFSYSKNSNFVLQDINLEIFSGQKIAIVGQSGSGKSSLGKVLSGLYSVESNRIFFNGVDISKINKKSFSQSMGVVPQDTFLLNKSILQNITLNNKDICYDRVVDICKAVQIHNEIEAMPMGYHTIVSEMGQNLSGGQRQRIAIARALINSPKLVLFDEATSSLDTINEQKITNFLRHQGCTQVIIAHRLSTIVDADKIFVLKEGKIVESGKHDELMELKGEYYGLYMKKSDLEMR